MIGKLMRKWFVNPELEMEIINLTLELEDAQEELDELRKQLADLGCDLMTMSNEVKLRKKLIECIKRDQIIRNKPEC